MRHVCRSARAGEQPTRLCPHYTDAKPKRDAGDPREHHHPRPFVFVLFVTHIAFAMGSHVREDVDASAASPERERRRVTNARGQASEELLFWLVTHCCALGVVGASLARHAFGRPFVVQIGIVNPHLGYETGFVVEPVSCVCMAVVWLWLWSAIGRNNEARIQLNEASRVESEAPLLGDDRKADA